MKSSPSQTLQTSPQNNRASHSQHANFVEALKSAGGGIAKDATKGFVQDFLLDTPGQMADSFFGSSPSSSQPNEQAQPFDFTEYLKSHESRTRSQERVKYEYQNTETVIFNRRQQEVEDRIKSIQLEIKKITKEIVHLDQATQAAAFQEIAKPGTYHLNFFEKLLSFLVTLRKRVVESRHWASLHQQRQQAKSYYWHMSQQKVGGTGFSMSQERALATQTG